MKDSAVGPVGLFDTRRQKRLLDGLVGRVRNCLHQQRRLQVAHDLERQQEDASLEQQRIKTMETCRMIRRDILGQWDEAEEQLTRRYERSTVTQRAEYEKLNSRFRRKLAEEKQAIDHAAKKKRRVIEHHYQQAKPGPAKRQRRAYKQIDEALKPFAMQLESLRTLTIQRLDRLPDVDDLVDAQSIEIPETETIEEAIAGIGDLRQRADDVHFEMRQGIAAKLIDSYVLPIAAIVVMIAWAVAAFYVAPAPKWIWMIGGMLGAGMLAFVVYLIALIPLKKMTKRVYPRVEALARAAERCADQGRQLAKRAAALQAGQLVQQRDDQLSEVTQWQKDQLRQLEERLKAEQEAMKLKMLADLEATEKDYLQTFAETDRQLRQKADQVAQQISQQLQEVDQDIQQQRTQSEAQRKAQIERIAHRFNLGIRRGLERIHASAQLVNRRFPPWDDVLDGPALAEQTLEFLPMGSLDVGEHLRQWLTEISQESSAADETASDELEQVKTLPSEISELLQRVDLPSNVPVAIHRRRHCGVVIRCDPSQIDQAMKLVHCWLWRLLTGAPPGRAKLTLIDPLGRGQHFTSFMALTDHDPGLVGHRVWTTESKIESRLGELAHHVEDVLQSSLRDRFERIEDYNEVAGSMAEPYRAVAAVGFPESLSRESYRHLQALLESGLRCGVFTMLVCDSSKPWPSDMPLPLSDKVLQLELDASGQWHVISDGLEALPLQPPLPPSPAQRHGLVEKVGAAAIAASRVEIPIESILVPTESGTGSTDDGIQIPIGSQGANRRLALDLGEGVRQHVLIAGKTGSGKSTLLHSIITSGAFQYRPDQLQFYLLDFKKGVEFKPYAELGLPHARVIGIESEREFGRSVLQRLDEELQQRGEAFRAAGVQELGEYRAKTKQSMPRIMLIVDEFQELFVRDDRLAADCAMLLDRLVRQGRSFGMHVVLSSQSLAGAYSLPRATLGQMAVRIAMQCSESDAALILADDNTAARLISRPGEAIYNDAGGLVEGNQPFQVAWMTSTSHREQLRQIVDRGDVETDQLEPPVIFEGNRPCRWTPRLASAAIGSEKRLTGLLGESVEIGPPAGLELAPTPGRNVLMIAPPENRSAVIASIVSALAKSDPRLSVVYFDGARVEEGERAAEWLDDAGISITRVRPRDSQAEMQKLNELIQQRGDDASDAPPVLVIVDPLERFRDFRQDDSFNFSLDAAAETNGASALQNVLRDGPSANVYTILVCGSAETMSRWLPRSSQHDLELRILGQMNQTDSALLIDSPIASELSAATMLLYDDSDGRIRKFRQCDLPDPVVVRQWLET